MGIKDTYQYDYLDDDERFADQVNGALFQGRQVVKPEELEPADERAVYLGEKAGNQDAVEVISDKTRTWRGRLLHIITIQNQTYVDYRMVLRNMLTESIGYHRQWKRKRTAHRRSGDLTDDSDAFLSGMERDEKFIPIITLVVYCGREHGWNSARCLYDLLDIDDEMKEYVSNYKLNLYDCQAHDTFDEYHTGLKQLFETIRYSGDKRQLKRVIDRDRESYSRIDGDTRRMLEVMANVRIPEGYKIMESGKERYDMCKAIEDMIADGRTEGKIEGKMDAIFELLKELGQVSPQIVENIRTEDNMSVLNKWLKSAAKATNIAEFEANM